jgi:lysophospholipase L1-like esterase
MVPGPLPLPLINSASESMKIVNRKLNSSPVLYLTFILLALLLPGKAFCESDSISIISFGDSLTEGCAIEGEVCGWVGGYGYWLELASILADNDWDIPIYNFGKGGETTSKGVNRIDDVLANPCTQDAGYLLLLEGTNDLFHHDPLANIIFNLEVMIEKTRAKGIVPLIATVTPDPDHEYKQIYELNDLIRQLAADKKIILVDLYNALSPYWDIYTDPPGCYGDRLHPNWTGFQAMAAVWYDGFSGLLKRPLRPMPWLFLLLDNRR